MISLDLRARDFISLSRSLRETGNVNTGNVNTGKKSEAPGRMFPICLPLAESELLSEGFVDGK